MADEKIRVRQLELDKKLAEGKGRIDSWRENQKFELSATVYYQGFGSLSVR